MALNHSASALSKSLRLISRKTLRKRKNNNPSTQYSVLEPRKLLAAMPLINEFVASNSDSLLDDNGNSTDWIELHNAGTDAVNLAGYTLTDDPDDPSKYVLPSTTLGASQYLIVFAGDDLDPANGTDLYTGFGLSSSGEYVGLYDSAGSLVSEFSAGGNDYPQQFSDVSYGYLNDGSFSTERFFATPTPGAANSGQTFSGVVEEPVASVERGFYDAAFNVQITSPTPGATLVYTIDGTEPTLSNGVQVAPANSSSSAQTNLFVSTTTSLRATAFRTGFLTQGATTNTYVFLDDTIANDLDPGITQDPRYSNLIRDSLLDIPTLSFNYETAIDNSQQPEQRLSVEWLAPDGSEGFQLDAGITAFGGNSTDFDKKSFRLHFRSEYGDSRLEFPLFEGFDKGITPTESFDQLEFRSGSHDMSARGFYHSNRFVDDTLLEAGHVVPHGRFVHLYTNGVYWGQYHMRERWNADFLAQYYGGEEEDFEAVNGNVNNGNNTPFGWDPGSIYDGDGTIWANIQALADVDGSGNPTGGYQQLKEVVNLEQYIDFMLVYMAGASENEYRGGGSDEVGYSFYLNDADGWLRDPLDVRGRQGGDKTSNPGPGNILGRLVSEADPEFLTLYADRIQRMFFNDGPLTVEKSVDRLQARLDEVELSFLAESARWGARTPDSYNNAAAEAINNRLPELTQSMIDRLRAAGAFPDFDAPGYQVDGIAQNGGAVTADAALTFTAPDTVYYTVDGSDPRLAGGGINPNAIAFDTELSETTPVDFESSWRYLDDGSNQGTGWRSSSFNDSAWESGDAILGYGGNGEQTVIEFGPDANNKYITTYFRKTFNLAEGGFSSATFDLIRDDGAVVYLNGVEIGRSNLPGGTIFFNTFAEDSVNNANEGVVHNFNFDPGLLQPGNNTLAVEIHQATAGSSDLSFDGRLRVVSTSGEESQAYVLDRSTNVNSRTFVNGQWSGLTAATFVIPVSQSEVRISEIQFNPADPTATELMAGFVDNNQFEFLEILNPNPIGSINLAGLQLSQGVAYNFGDVDLAPGERAVVVRDADAFRERYGDDIQILGQWTGGLNNGGERVTLVDANLVEIMSVNYGDSDPWYEATDGLGFSLVLDQPSNTPDAELGKYYSWRASTEFGGTPGTASAQPLGVVVNEILANSDDAQSDSIELFNTTGSAINVGGWYLSDSGGDLLKFQIPAGTVIAAGGYLVFDEQDFNPNPANPGANDFALSASSGDQVYLSQASGGALIGLQDAVTFNATFDGESLGRLPNGTGRLTRLAANSFGSANSTALVGPLVISEVNYNPSDPTNAALAIDASLTDDDLEFIEITNPTSATIDLTDWRIRGEVDFDFSAGSSLSAGESIVIVSFDPSVDTTKRSAFVTNYGISFDVNLVGGFDGGLSNSSGRISLQQPDTPDMSEIPHVVVDEVVYDDLAPWADADGSGDSLNRNSASVNGSLAASWVADSPTPGVSDLVSAAAPQVTNTIRDGGGVLARPDLMSTYSVTFDQGVNVSAGDLLIGNQTFGVLVNTSDIGFSYNASTFTATWNFSSLPDLEASYYTFGLSNSITSTSGGEALDGDGDGAVGGSYFETIYVAIPGDANLDGDVEVNDINIFLGTNTGDGATVLSNLGAPGTFNWSQGDFNADGDVDSSQLNIFSGVQSGDYAVFLANLGRNVRPANSQFVTSQPVVSQPVVSQPVISQQVAESPAALPVFATVQATSSVADPIESSMSVAPVESVTSIASVELTQVASTMVTDSVAASEPALSGTQANVDVLIEDVRQLVFRTEANETTGPLVVAANSVLELEGAQDLLDSLFSGAVNDGQHDVAENTDEAANDGFADDWDWLSFS